MIIIKDVSIIFKIEKGNLKNPKDKEIIVVKDNVPNPTSRNSYLQLTNFYSKVEKGGREGLSKLDFQIIKENANNNGYHCSYCKQTLYKNASIDHIKPYYLGGDSHHSNIQIIR